MNHLLFEFARLQNEFPHLAELLLGLLKSSAILTMAFAAAALLSKRSARARSWIWRMAFLGLAALWISGLMPAGTARTALTWKAVPVVATQAVIPPPPVERAGMGYGQVAGETKVRSSSALIGMVEKFIPVAWWAVAGVLAMGHLLKVVLGGIWLRRNSRPVARALPVSAPIEIRFGKAVDAPLLAGLLSPAIYLPECAASWPSAKLRAVLGHEMAHFRRGDLWWQFGGTMVSSVWWGNPLAWIALRALKGEAEEAADDVVVVQEAGAAEGYARLLVEIASGPTRPAPTGISMLGRSSLEKRLRAILAANPLRGTIGGPGVALLSSLATLLLVCLSAGIALAEVDLTNGKGEVRHYQADPAKTQLPQGNFRVTGGTLKDWSGALDHAASPQRGLVRLKSGADTVAIETVVAVDPSWKWLTVRARTRPGGEGKFDPDQKGEVTFTPEGPDGRVTGPVITLVDARREGYTNWASPMDTFAVPAGTAKLKVGLRLTPGKATFDCSEIFVIPSDPEDELDHRLVDRFFDAIKASDAATVESLLKAEPKLANSRRGSQDNGTPLTLCAWNELPEMAELLIKNGANLEAEDTGAWRSTPLTWCGWWGSPKTAKVLLEAGANPKVTSAFGVTPLSSAKAGKGANRASKATPADFDNVISLLASAQK